MKKIGIIGHFGGDEVFLDGQTVKTKNLKTLVEDYCKLDTYCVDTYWAREKKLNLLMRSLLCLMKCKRIVILLGENGMGFYLPFLYWTNKLFRRKIYHYVIGNELIEMVGANPKLVKYLNALRINWFEYESGSEALRRMGLKNVETLSNCKKLEAVELEQITPYAVKDDSYTFCTFSRVTEKKGITDAIVAVAKINAQRGKMVARLDIYGQVDEAYRPTFDELISKHSDYVTYRGLVDSEQSVDVLRHYYALLFPTHWRGEGFPGTILDCYASALPILASDWNANKEIVVHTKTGMIYPTPEVKDLLGVIEWALDNKDEVDRMRFACRQEYEKYTPEHIAEIIGSALMRE